MRGMRIRQFMMLLGLLSLGGCAATQQQKSDISAVTSSGAPPVIAAKMENYAPLDLSDIETLSRKKVPEAITLRYLRARRTIYSLDVKSIKELHAAGVSDALVNYLLSTPSLYSMDQKQWLLNPANNPTRDPLRNGQAIPRYY